MERDKSSRAEYSSYCSEHLDDFKRELRDDASLAITSWPGRSVALLMILSSALNYFVATSDGNPFATYILFSYSVPILVVLLYPILTIAASTMEKYSPAVLDLVCILGLLSYSLTIHFVLLGVMQNEDVQRVYLQLSGQANMILLLSTTFSYHASYIFTVIRNALLLPRSVFFFFMLIMNYFR